MSRNDFLESNGYVWNEKEQCYERPIQKTERKNPNVFHLPERTGGVVQEPAGTGQGKKVRAKRNAAAAGRDPIQVERHIIVNFKIPNYKRRDLDGMLASTLDQLVHAGIIPDDSVSQLQREFVCFTISEVPGIEIIIIEYEA